MDKRVLILQKKYDLPVEIWDIINETLRECIRQMMQPAPAVVKLFPRKLFFIRPYCWREDIPICENYIIRSYALYNRSNTEVSTCPCRYCEERRKNAMITNRLRAEAHYYIYRLI